MEIINFRGCEIPSDLYFHPEHDNWVRLEENGTVTMGMTDVAQTMSGKLIYIKFKNVGRVLEAGKNAATIESAKWVGPFIVPFFTEILAVNTQAFEDDILIANRDPYGAGWLLKLKAPPIEELESAWLSGDAAFDHIKAKVLENDMHCFRCID